MIETTGERWYERLDSAGAVYGSLLAASVVVAQSPLQVAVPPGELAALLLGTGLVFWLVHVYTRTVGEYVAGGRLTWSTLTHAAEDEIPIVLAALPPAAAALVAGALGAYSVRGGLVGVRHSALRAGRLGRGGDPPGRGTGARDRRIRADQPRTGSCPGRVEGRDRALSAHRAGPIGASSRTVVS